MADEAKAPTKAKGRKSIAPPAKPAASERQTTLYQQAAGALESSLKELGLSTEAIQAETRTLAEKCGVEYDVVSVAVWAPFGGAKSFAEYDSYRRGQELQYEYDDLSYTLGRLMDNVLSSDSATGDKAAAITALATEFATRADNIRADGGSGAEIAGKEEMPATSTRVGSTGAKGTSFKAFKEGEAWHWFAVYSNTGVDKAKEWFSEAAHKDYVDHVWADPQNRMPELWDWHTPVGAATYHDGRKGMGRADFIDFADGLAIASGHFYPEFNYAAEALAAEKELGVSHGYEYDSTWLKPSGEYTAYRSFEISPLPRSRAANELTLFMPELAEKETPMFNETRRPHLVAIHGEAKVKAMEAALAPAAAALKAAGKEVNFKDLEDALAASEASAAAAPSVPVGNAAAGATSEKDAAAWAGVIIAAVKEGIAPLEARLAKLETPVAPRTAEEIALAAVKEAFGPRVTPAPGQAPSESASTVINGNAGAVQAAKAAAKDDGVAGVPDHLQYYFKNGAASLLGSFDAMSGLPDADGVAAAVAAASARA
jgi:hypothetical protein